MLGLRQSGEINALKGDYYEKTDCRHIGVCNGAFLCFMQKFIRAGRLALVRYVGQKHDKTDGSLVSHVNDKSLCTTDVGKTCRTEWVGIPRN